MTPEELHEQFDKLGDFSKDLVAFSALMMDLVDNQSLSREQKAQTVFTAFKVFRATNILGLLVKTGDIWKTEDNNPRALSSILSSWYTFFNNEYEKDQKVLRELLDDIPEYAKIKRQMSGVKHEPEVIQSAIKKGERK